jgi:hypothetical protein
VTTYHHDPQWTPIIGLITLDVGEGETTIATNLAVSTGWNPVAISTVTFNFESNGIDDVVIRLVPTENAAPINGFELVYLGTVPSEDTTWGTIKSLFSQNQVVLSENSNTLWAQCPKTRLTSL